ncbi:MAG: hypothetical protein ACRENI_05630 [Gemmatimonadaceae bacterium]
MAGTKLDGAGIAKLNTLEDAVTQLQRVHGLVEQMAMAQRQEKSIASYGLQIRRAATPLVGQLKGQFGMISDIVTGLILVATRGGNEQAKVRALREAVGQIRIQLEMAQNKVKEQHTVDMEGGNEE